MSTNCARADDIALPIDLPEFSYVNSILSSLEISNLYNLEISNLYNLAEIFKGAVYVLLIPLAFTIIIEAVIAYLMNYRYKFSQYRIALINLITNISANLINLIFIKLSDFSWSWFNYILFIIVLEVFVIIAEWKLFKRWLKIDNKAAIKLSLILNISSYLIGLYFKLSLLLT